MYIIPTPTNYALFTVSLNTIFTWIFVEET